MQRWAPLNDRQLAVLQRIGAGVEPVSSRNPELATTVYALRRRGLVSAPRQRGTWVAEVTDAGRFYLEHGCYLRKPIEPSVTTSAPKPVRPTDDKDRIAAELIAHVQQEGGTLTIADPDDKTRKHYRSAISLAKRRGAVPEGYHLLHTGRDIGDVIIRLEKDSERDDTDWNRIRLSARDLIKDPAQVAVRLASDPNAVNVRKTALPRALALMQALADAFSQHGHALAVSRRQRPPGCFIQAWGCQFPVSLHDEHEQEPPRLTLKIQIGPNDTRSWLDDHVAPLEAKLLAIAEEFEPIAAAAEQGRVEKERAWAAQLEEWRLEEESQEREWKIAMSRAKRQAREKRRQDTFFEAMDDWSAAERIRAFCAALEQASADGTTKQKSCIARWVAWARVRADRIDPTTTLSALTDAWFNFEPEPDDLRPFLDGWSPEEPEREWRSNRPATVNDNSRGDESASARRAEPTPNQWWRR